MINRWLMQCLLLSGLLCGSGCEQRAVDVIHVGLDASPVTLDPRFATDATSSRICRLLYRSLVDFDEHFNMVPDLATWQQLDPLHYRFLLGNDGRVFHDGVRLTASDVKATYDSVLDPATASPHRGSLAMIERIEIIDEQTIDFILQRPDTLFPGRLLIGILPAAQIEAQHFFSQQPIGSGRLQFVARDSANDLQLKRRVDQQLIRFLVVKDDTVRALKLLRGELDLIQGGLSPDIVNWLRQHPSVRVQSVRGNTFTYIGFNMEDAATRQLPVRQAIAHAIDREEIVKYVMRNTARLAGALFPAEHWVSDPELAGYSYDPERARALLASLGFDREHPLRLSYKTSNNPFRIRLATVIQSQLQAVGIDIKIRSYDWGTFYGDIKEGRFQLYSLSWVGLKTPDIFRYVFHSEAVPPKGANRGRFNSSQMDALITQAEASMVLNEQAAIYQKIQHLLHEALPYIPLWFENTVLVQRADIADYYLSSDGDFDGLFFVHRQ